MKLTPKSLRGIFLFAAIFSITWGAHAQSQAGPGMEGNTDVWLQRFNTQIGSAYLLKPLSGFQGGPTTEDVYIELVDWKKRQSELVAFQNKKSLGIGCFVARNLENEAPQHKLCQKQAHRNIDLNQLQLPECRLDINPKSSYRLGAKYFVSNRGTQAICIYAAPTQVDQDLSKESRTNPIHLMVMSIEPIWEDDQREGSRPNSSVGLLAYFFPSAPIAQLSRIGLNGARNCYDFPHSLGAFATDNANIESAKIPALRHPDLRWSYLYLVGLEKRIACGDAHYDIDVLNSPLVYGLADNTMLIRGQRSVLRVRVSDGSTDASVQLVKRVPSRTFIETMQTDGGMGCQSDQEKPRCKWLVQQDWYTYEKRYPDGSAGELFHSKFWFQGFDQAIKRIFFKQGE